MSDTSSHGEILGVKVRQVRAYYPEGIDTIYISIIVEVWR